MAEAVRRQAWAHTSHLLAMLANANPFRSGPVLHPRQFNPYATDVRAAEESTEKVELGVWLRAMAATQVKR